MNLKILISLTILLNSFYAHSQTIYISPSGSDKNDGSFKKPFKTISYAIEKIINLKGDHELIISEGTYAERIYLKGQGLGKITIRAAMKNKVYEKVIIDQAPRVHQNSKKVVNYKNVNQAKLNQGFLIYQSRPDVWELDTRVRYRQVADIEAVENEKASFCIEGTTLFFHTSDNKAPSQHEIGHNLLPKNYWPGIHVYRPNINIEGLHLHHFGVNIVADYVTIKDCHVWNTWGGYYVSSKVKHAKVIRSKAIDVGFGFRSEGINAIVEDCQFIRKLDRFESHEITQFASGIQYYSSNGGTIKRNLVVGFPLGIFIKASGKKFIVENNTLYHPKPMLDTLGIERTKYRPYDIVRNNIVCNYGLPFMQAANHRFSQDMIMEQNLFWGVSDQSVIKMTFDVFSKFNLGKQTIYTDPLFINPESGDFRLLPDSPAAKSNGKYFGAFDLVTTNLTDTSPPTLKIKLNQKTKGNLLTTRVETFKEDDPWKNAAKERTLISSKIEKDHHLEWLVKGNDIFLDLQAHDNFGKIKYISYKTNSGEWADPVAFKPLFFLKLPKEDSQITLKIKVSDTAGLWSEPQKVKFYLSQKPVQKNIRIIQNKHGFNILFKTKQPCHAYLEWGHHQTLHSNKIFSKRKRSSWDPDTGALWTFERKQPTDTHYFKVIPPKNSPSHIFYRITLDNGSGDKTSFQDTIFLKGKTSSYYVSPNGADTNKGTLQSPWRSLQYASAYALPGDTIYLRKGLYSEEVYLSMKGTEKSPLTIQAYKNERVIFDGFKRIMGLLHIHNSTHILIEGLEFRWFDDSEKSECFYGASIINSKHIKFRSCRFWNNPWKKGRRLGSGVLFYNSPFGELSRCLFYAMNESFVFVLSPNFNMQHNTAAGLFHRGSRMVYSSKNSIFKNNSFTFTGSDHFQAIEKEEDWKSFVCDYNNLAALVIKSLRKNDQITRKDLPYRPWVSTAKSINHIYLGWPPRNKIRAFTLEEWQKQTGKDQNSIFKVPHYVNPMLGNFYLKAHSPNLNSGEMKATIGAFGTK